MKQIRVIQVNLLHWNSVENQRERLKTGKYWAFMISDEIVQKCNRVKMVKFHIIWNIPNMKNKLVTTKKYNCLFLWLSFYLHGLGLNAL